MIIIIINVCFWERQTVRVGEGQRERETQNPKQVPGSKPDEGLKPTKREIVTWAKVGRLTDHATHAPLQISLITLQTIYIWNGAFTLHKPFVL